MTKTVWTVATSLAVAGIAAMWFGPRSDGSTADAAGLRAAISIEDADAAGRRARVAEGAPEPQRAAIADGEVTLGEYRSAVQRTITCFRRELGDLAEERGFDRSDVTVEVDGPVVSSDRFAVTYGYSVTGPAAAEATIEDQNAVSALEQRCQRDQQQAVEEVYRIERLADPAYTRRVAAAFAACVEKTTDVEIDERDEAAVVGEIVTGMRGRSGEAIQACLFETPSVSSGLAQR